MKKPIKPASFAVLAAFVVAAPVWAASAEPTVRIVAPAMGAAPITTAEIPVTVAASNFDVECKNVGQSAKSARGHYHVMIDGMTMAQMTNLYCTNSFAISGAALKAGEHTLAVVLASDDHVNVGKPAMTKFVYQPATPHPLPKAEVAQKSTVAILSPKNGATVGRTLSVRVAVSGFDLSCDLEGKPDVAGYGHLHVFVLQNGMMAPATGMHGDGEMQGVEMKGDMKAVDLKDEKGNGMKMGGMENMAMPGMVGMPCSKTVPLDLSAWNPGKTKLMVMLANNDHMPTAGAVPAIIDVTLK